MAMGVGPQTVSYDEEVTLFSLAEIDELAAGAGLNRFAAAGNYDGAQLQPANNDRWLLLYGCDTESVPGPESGPECG